jgi:mitotic spindle assembly checkpoint protein MAD1
LFQVDGLYLDPEKDELRVQVNTLKYELENSKQERELMVLRHEKELRELQSRADADFRKAQASQLGKLLLFGYRL